MNNWFLFFFEDVVIAKIKCRNAERILTTIYKNKIKLWSVEIINRHEFIIKLKQSDLNQIQKNKTIEEVLIIEYCGKLKIKKFCYNQRIIILSLLFSYIILLLLSNIIFDIQVIHNNRDIRNLLINELADNGIKRLKFKKDYNKLEQIEEEILNKYKNKLEWLEIEEIGTKYIVKVEERKLPVKEEEYIYQDIIATKDAVILKIEAINGIILKKINNYVKKGDIIITGQIKNGEKLKNIMKASGKIFGEVWYNIKVEFPVFYYSKKETGKARNIYTIKFLDYRFPLFDFKPFKDKQTTEQTLLKHRFLPFQITRETQKELKIIDKVYTDSELLIKAQELAVEKMQAKLGEGEYIINKRILKYYHENQKVYLDLFFKVCENITGTKEITLEEEDT